MSFLQNMFPDTWSILQTEFSQPYMSQLEGFLQQEWNNHTIFPPQQDIFSAYALVPYQQVRVLILGQDPYHGPGQAHGLSFSVKPGVPVPPSLRNMFTELHSDMGISPSAQGHLIHWALQGVMMLNSILTVREKSPASHQKKGWEHFTDETIRVLNQREKPLVFVLWGGKAKKKAKLIDTEKHHVITGVHPSPLSAYNGFFGSRPFSQINEKLVEWGYLPIDWEIPQEQLALF